MGRYYSGDIEGKFWFAVQSSDAADRFGVTGTNNYIEYYFDEGNLEDVQKELKNIMTTIGEENFNKIKEFFEKVNSYNDKIMEEQGLEVSLWEKHKSDYADYLLGKKIEQCIIEEGSCSFTAEL